MRIGKFAKAPGDRKRYTIDYTQWLDDDETLVNVHTAVPDDPLGIYVDGVLIMENERHVVMFVSGGQEGRSYDLGIRVNTNADQTKDDFVTFVVMDVPDVFEV